MLWDLFPLNNDKKYISYDVNSLFTNMPLKETIDYILDEIYENRKMKPICSKLIFKRLFYKLTTACTFHFNTKFVKKQMAAQWVEFCPLLYQISTWLRLPVHWSSRVPKRYKRNDVTGYLHRSKIISTNFQMEINVIKCKF